MHDRTIWQCLIRSQRKIATAPFLFRAVSLSGNKSDESVKDKWRIMRTRREQRARITSGIGRWWMESGRHRGDYSDEWRNLRRRDERRETAKLNGCDPSCVWARLFRGARVENFPDVCMNKFFSPPSARSKLLVAGSMYHDYWPPKIYQLSSRSITTHKHILD